MIKKLAIETALKKLRAIRDRQLKGGTDIVYDHVDADTILLRLIHNDKIANVFHDIRKYRAYD
jgi:hypothetical protein